MKKNKTIAIHIQSEVQFYSIEPVLRFLKKKPYNMIILIERHEKNEEGHKERSMGVVQLMKEYGYSPKYSEDYLDKEFDLCLTPYIDGMVKAKCYLKYEYGSLNTKPVLTYIPSILKGFHGFLCPATDGVNLLSIYGRTFPVDNLRFLGKKRVVNKGRKKIVLYAPTYNDEYDINEDRRIIAELKKKYYVIIKAHHGIKFLKKNMAKNGVLKENADEYYGSEVNLIDLMMRADICLANCSSVIGDAMRAGVPCAVYTHDIDAFRWLDFHSTQYDLYRSGELLICSNPSKLLEVIDKVSTKTYMKKWNKLSDRFFPKEYRTGVKGYLEVIDYYLDNPEAQKVIMLHDHYLLEQRNEIKMREELIDEMDRYIKALEREREDLTKRLDSFSRKKLYRMVGAVYGVGRKIVKRRIIHN
ncbi:CDP-glycerol glycerophosphotransferase family protein [Candidatus Saccharibacteria bacterium]|nr:CDP-glycerol glycerophosphotransferase family protein [Candidatus Saccharibacteria bacterium]